MYSIMQDTSLKAKFNASFCFLDSERKVNGAYRGYQSLYINHRASFKNAALERQYFLVHKIEQEEGKNMDEAYQTALQEMFFERSLKKLPLTISKEWEKFTWGYLKNYFKELQIVGKTPYGKAFVLDLPNATVLQGIVERSHASFEFNSRFKRVPRVEALLAVCDIENFDFKEWQKFVNDIVGGQEEFDKISLDHQEALVRAFEIYGAEKIVLDLRTTWHSTNLKNVNIMIRMATDKNVKNAIKAGFKKLIDMCYEKNLASYIFPAINSFERIWKDHKASIQQGNLDPIKAFLDTIQYENVIIGAEELAACCAKAKVSEDGYRKFQTQYLDNLDKILVAPRSYPTIISRVDNKLVWEMLDMSIPRAWTVGIETNCCMHPNGPGGACLVYAAKNPETSGVLRIEENGKTIAQSFMWLGAPDKDGLRTMVLDNIEFLGNNMRDTLKEAYNSFGDTMARYAKVFRIKAITIGAGYTNISLSDLCNQPSALETSSRYYAPKPETLGYYDARTQWLFRTFDNEIAKKKD